MKILVAASTFPSSDTDPVPAFVKDQIIAFKKQNKAIHISVLAPHDARAKTKPYTRHADYDEYRFHYMIPHSWEKLAGRGILPQLKKNPLYYLVIPFFFIAEFITLLRLTRKLQPDFIYAHWFTPQGVVAGMVSALTRTPYVITSHAADVAVWKKIPFGAKIVRHYVNKASAITAVSPRTLEKLRYFFSDKQWRHLADKVAIIPMGVTLTEKQPAARKAGQNILFIGRLAEKKGVQYLLPAFAHIATRFPDATLTIAGDGPLLKELQAQAQQLSLPENRVEFAGYVSGSQKQSYFEAADIYTVPSIITDNGDAEGLPVTLMEGLAAGKICIATNESGADYIIKDGVSGYLVPHKDVKSLEKALISALKLKLEVRRKMQRDAQKAARQFDWTKVAADHLRFFEAHLGER